MRWKKWQRWIQTVYDETKTLALYRHVFWEVQDIIRRNDVLHIPSVYYSFSGATYSAFAVMAIRRQLKVDHRSISLARLLTELKQHPSEASRKRFLDLYKGTVAEDWAEKDFARFSNDAEQLDPRIPEADLESLRRVAKTCEAFADRRIAHYDRSPPETLPKFNDVDAAIDEIIRIVARYKLLLEAVSIGDPTPTIQYDWKEIFRVAWIPEDTDA